jgi:uncharacterized membrane protein YfcA
MLFETAGIQVNPLIPPLVAFVVSFFTSMGGVSGAFLLLPFQMTFLGYINPSVSATNQLFNVVAIPSGVYRYCKEGRMVWPLTWIVVIGTLPGVFIGAVIRVFYLPDPKNFKLFAAAVLLYVGDQMVRDLVLGKNAKNANKSNSEKRFQEIVRRPNSGASDDATKPVRVTRFNMKRLGYTFYDESFDVPFWGIFALSFVVGIAGGVYGIGGGSIMAPFFVTVFGLPVYYGCRSCTHGNIRHIGCWRYFLSRACVVLPNNFGGTRLATWPFVWGGWYGWHVLRRALSEVCSI